MEIIYLLLMLILTCVLGLAIYLLAFFLTKRIVKKDARTSLIKRVICNNDTSCSCCNGNCEKFAEEVLSGEKSLDECPKISSQNKEELKELLNISPNPNGKQVAVVLCKGGNRASNQFGYAGPTSCDYSNRLFDGLKVCEYGCQGCLDCAKVCPTGAIRKNNVGVAEIDRSLCIGCGECLKACPDGLIKLIGLDQVVEVCCKQAQNQKIKDEVKDFCGVGCTKCLRCVETCPSHALYEENGIIKFDNSKCVNCFKCVGACPNSTVSGMKSDFLNF